MTEIFSTKFHKAVYPGDCLKLQKHIIPKLDVVFEETAEDNQGSMRQGGLCSYNVVSNLAERIDLLDLEDFVLTEAKKFWKEMEYTETGCKMFKSWANKYPHNSFIDSHNHAPISLTASFYLQKPENSGDLVFENPLNSILKYQPYKQLTDLSNYHNLFDYKLSVSEGDLIIFPGYLNHKTTVNLSRADRITIGFNIIAL